MNPIVFVLFGLCIALPISAANPVPGNIEATEESLSSPSFFKNQDLPRMDTTKRSLRQSSAQNLMEVNMMVSTSMVHVNFETETGVPFVTRKVTHKIKDAHFASVSDGHYSVSAYQVESGHVTVNVITRPGRKLKSGGKSLRVSQLYQFSERNFGFPAETGKVTFRSQTQLIDYHYDTKNGVPTLTVETTKSRAPGCTKPAIHKSNAHTIKLLCYDGKYVSAYIFTKPGYSVGFSGPVIPSVAQHYSLLQ